MKKHLRFLLIGTLALLTACQSIYDSPDIASPTVQIPHTDAQWQQHLAQLQRINHYAVKGQFGYISPQERFSSHFDWQYQTPSDFRLTLSSNLSNKSLTLQRHARGITVSDSEGKSRVASDIQALMKEMIGVSFPIDQFTYWVKGQPEKEGNYIVNEKRQLAQFHYPINGSVWQVNFVEYHENHSPQLPKLITLINGQQTLKIRLDQWSY